MTQYSIIASVVARYEGLTSQETVWQNEARL